MFSSCWIVVDSVIGKAAWNNSRFCFLLLSLNTFYGVENCIRTLFSKMRYPWFTGSAKGLDISFDLVCSQQEIWHVRNSTLFLAVTLSDEAEILKQKPYKKPSLHTVLNKQVALGNPHKAARCLLKRFSFWGFWAVYQVTASNEEACSLAVGVIGAQRWAAPNSNIFCNDQISSSEKIFEALEISLAITIKQWNKIIKREALNKGN